MNHPHRRHDKPTPTDFEIHELIRRRWSPRAFAPTPVPSEVLGQLFEAARWAPSSSNAQPWRFLLTRAGEESFGKLHSCLSRGNRPWTERVPVLLLSATDTMFAAKGDKPARENPTAQHDLGLAAANLALQATALGLYVHPMAGFDRERVREVFAIPSPYEPVTVTAIGYLADLDTLAEAEREREEAPRSRKSLREIVFAGGWGEPATLD
jgi:nitroreductase